LLGELEVVTRDAPGETRQSLSVTDQESGEQYRFVLPGPEWSGEDLERLVAALERQSMAGDLIVLSGSLPPGAPAEFPLDLARALSGRRVVLDTSGQALAQAARGERADLELLRMDSHEARELSGQGLQRMDESADFARALVCSGAARAVIIACGKDGSVMADASGLWRVNAANTHVVSAVGAGDSFVGGFVRAVALGEAAHEALRQGAAAAAAACLSEGSQLCRPEDFTRMLRHTQAVRSGEL
jgi:6-phosphofructokinase 2